MSAASPEPRERGALARNVVAFVRTLRAAGLSVGPAATLEALRALSLLELGQREEVRAGLRAVLVQRREDLELFEQAFAHFFRDAYGRDAALALLLPHSQLPTTSQAPGMLRRAAEAFLPPHRPRGEPPAPPRDPIEVDAVLTFSDREVLRSRDFAEMSADELLATQRLIARMRFGLMPKKTRRLRPARRGALLDLRRLLRESLRTGGEDLRLRHRTPRLEPPPLCVLCDISGSMARYTEMLLRFVHTLVSRRRKVEAFVMGTRLTQVTRLLRDRDIDLALRRVGTKVEDWGGGTRLASCLRDFNLHYARRVLSQGAVVLLISDGLERDHLETLGSEAARLQRSCRRLVWLNPLLGYDGFAPLAQGIRALLPHVDEHRPVHNLESLEQLVASLESSGGERRQRRGMPSI